MNARRLHREPSGLWVVRCTRCRRFRRSLRVYAATLPRDQVLSEAGDAVRYHIQQHHMTEGTRR